MHFVYRVLLIKLLLLQAMVTGREVGEAWSVSGIGRGEINRVEETGGQEGGEEGVPGGPSLSETDA